MPISGGNFSISDSNAINVDLSTLFMQPSDDLLAAAIVQRPPMGIKKDTVEYNAGLFATKPNATAEDLLKKMPGVQVDNGGNARRTRVRRSSGCWSMGSDSSVTIQRRPRGTCRPM